MVKLTDLIENNIQSYTLEYRIHATKRMFSREIHEDDVEAVLLNGQIIERYDNDSPLPSLLVNGFRSDRRPLHIVAGINDPEKAIVIITAYEPDSSRWANGFSERVK